MEVADKPLTTFGVRNKIFGFEKPK